MRSDWDQIRMEYVTGADNLRALAAKYRISISTIGTRAAREGWQEMREQERAKICGHVLMQTRSKRIKREAMALDRVEGQIERIIGVIEKALSDEDQLYRHVIYVGKGMQDEQTLAKMDTKAARDFVSMLHELKAMLDEYSMKLDMRTREEIRLKKARLKLDRQKAGLTGTEQGETGVIMLPEVIPETEAESSVVCLAGTDCTAAGSPCSKS